MNVAKDEADLIVKEHKRAEERADEILKNNIPLLMEQHFAECCNEEEEACTSLFLNGLLCTRPLTPGWCPAEHGRRNVGLTIVNMLTT